MSPAKPTRQPEGIPAGGQFAAGTHAEPDLSLQPSAAPPPKIMATVILQRWVNDEAQPVGEVVFDAGRILAAMTREQRSSIEDDDDSADAIFYAGVEQGLVAHHDGPFSVYVEDAIAEAEAKDPEVFAKIAALPDNRPAEAILHEPLTPYEIGARADENGWVEGLATFDMSDLIDNDLDGHGDQIGEKLVGSELLMDVSARPVSVDPDGSIVCRLSGDASAIIDGFDEDELAAYEAGHREGAEK